MAKKGKGGFVEGHDEGVGKGNFANMPQEAMMKSYPKNKGKRNENIDDTISDIDDVISNSESKRSRYISNQK